MNRIIRWAALAGLTAFAFALSGPANADENAIKYRQNVMKAQGAHAGAISAIAKGEVPHKGQLLDHAVGLAATAKMANDVFPKDSYIAGKTAALPVIWEKPDDFKQALAALNAAAAKLADVAKGGDMAAIQAAFGDVGKACGGCHNTFREKKS